MGKTKDIFLRPSQKEGEQRQKGRKISHIAQTNCLILNTLPLTTINFRIISGTYISYVYTLQTYYLN